MKKAIKPILGLLSVLLFLLAGGLHFYGGLVRDVAYIEEVENTASDKRAAVSEAYRQSWGIDEWSIAAFICVAAAGASAIAAFKLSKNKSSGTI